LPEVGGFTAAVRRKCRDWSDLVTPLVVRSCHQQKNNKYSVARKLVRVVNSYAGGYVFLFDSCCIENQLINEMS
jgi:hypothetical protein